MTLQLVAIVSSVVGAILFFFGGYLMARSASSPLPEAPRLKHPPDRAVRDSSAESLHGSESLADEVSASLKLDALRDEIATCRNRLAEAERERGRIANLEAEIQQRLEQQNKLEGESRQLHEERKRRAREADTLKDESSDLQRQFQRAQEEIKYLKEQAGRLNELEAERNQSIIEQESLIRQITELERYKEKNARLTTLVGEVPHLRDTIDRLKQENRELRSLGLAYQSPTATTHTMPAEHFGGSIQHLLERFAESKGTRGAALADEHGLLVAGTGKYTEGLAVTSALCDGLVTQVADILPLASLRQFVIADTNAVTAAFYPFQIGPNRLMLASLSVGLRPGSKAIEDFVNQASRLISGERSRNG